MRIGGGSLRRRGYSARMSRRVRRAQAANRRLAVGGWRLAVGSWPCVAVAMAVAIAVPAGCGGGGRTVDASSDGGALPVRIRDFQFQPKHLVVRRGQVLEVANDGDIAHNLTIERGSNPRTL